jgi:hypothetical protein
MHVRQGEYNPWSEESQLQDESSSAASPSGRRLRVI